MYGMQCNDIISNIVFIRRFLRYFQTERSAFLPFTVNCLHLSNNVILVSARTGRGWVVNQVWTGLDRWWGGGISKFVLTSFTDDPKPCRS